MSTENLYNEEAKKKIKDLAESIDFAMMATNLESKPLHMIPMSTKKVDSEGNIWFLSGKDSTHNHNISNDSKIHLVYSSKSNMQFLNLYGEAEISTDRKMIEELYGKADDTWFEGKNDPNLSAIKVSPKEAYYWDPKDNKLVTLVKMGLGAITGDEPDLMDEGKIDIK